MTSIEWFYEQYQAIDLGGNIDRLKVEELIEQAKEMHKQEIIDAVGVGSQFDRDYLYGYHDKAEQYYHETFVSKGSDTLKENHIVESNEMVEDDVEKLAEKFYPLNDELYPNSTLIRKAFIEGYNKAKETLYTEEQMNSFNERWAFSREQTRHISHRIGFGEGVRLGIAYSEEYYNQLEKTDKDEEDFESDYIDELYESLKQPKKD